MILFKRFERLVQKNLLLLADEKFTEIQKNDEKILKLAASLFRKRNYAETAGGILFKYISIQKIVNRYLVDSTVMNLSLQKYINAVFERKLIFGSEAEKWGNKIIGEMILAAFNIYDLRSGKRLLEEFYNEEDLIARCELFLKILDCPSGVLDMEKYIDPIFDALPENKKTYVGEEYDVLLKKCKELSERLNYRKEEIIAELRNVDNGAVKENRESSAKQSEKITLYQQMLKSITSRDKLRTEVYEDIEKVKAQHVAALKIEENQNIDRLCIFVNQLYVIKLQERSFAYWKRFNGTLKKVRRNKYSSAEAAYFFVNDYSLVNASFSLPILMEAEKRGCYCIPTSPKTFDFVKTEDSVLNDLAGCMDNGNDIRHKIRLPLKYKWDVDIENKAITADEGIYNIYQPIFEYVSRYQFTYFFRYDTDGWARAKANSFISIFDHIFQYCEEIEKWAVGRKCKVRFVSNAPHFPNAAAYRIFCEERGYKNDMKFVCVSGGYDNYFKNIGDARTETLAAINMTDNRRSRNAFLGTEEGFEKYYIENVSRYGEVEKKAEKWLAIQRSRKMSDSTGYKKKIINIIKEYKEDGKKVYLLNGKVIFDLGVMFTKGYAHSDMSDWITDTVEIINENPDILLLIKPHPHESLQSLTLTVKMEETLRSLIKTEMNDNVIYLRNDAFSMGELMEYIDIGLIWNGTSALEFAAYGKKVIVDDVWGHYDYPIRLPKAESRSQYREFLEHPETIPFNEELRKKAIMFLEYMGSEEVRIPNPYTKTTTLNFNQFDSEIYDTEIDKYIESGDRKLEALFDSLK